MARSLSNEKGIEGKKGVLRWEIYETLRAKNTPFLLLENVDRLLKSPSKQKGRDFGIMLKCLNELGYFVEWRVINAADYGFPQKRRRIYIFGYKNTTKYASKIKCISPQSILEKEGLFQSEFKVKESVKFKIKEIEIHRELLSFQQDFTFNFEDTGFMKDGIIYTAKSIPVTKKKKTLNSIVITNPDNKYFLSNEQINKFAYLRGSKKLLRTSKNGNQYYYSEGSMSPYDDLSLPGRTMLTSEGTVNRTSHIIKDKQSNKFRFLTPLECERMNGFPDNWTDVNLSDRKRYFLMGNALVVGIIKKIGKKLSVIFNEE